MTFKEYVILRESWLHNKFTQGLVKFVGRVVEKVLGPVIVTAGGVGAGAFGAAAGYAKGGTIGAILEGVTYSLIGFLGGAKLNQALVDWIHATTEKIAERIEAERIVDKNKIVNLTEKIVSRSPPPIEPSFEVS